MPDFKPERKGFKFVKFCKDCKHHQAPSIELSPASDYICLKKEQVNLVHGGKSFAGCLSTRYSSAINDCGNEAKWFEPSISK